MRTAPSKLRLVDGIFYRGSEVVKPTFGDQDQIKLLKEHEKNAELLMGEGVCVEPGTEEVTTIEVDVIFKCICGRSLNYSGELEVDWRGNADEFENFKRSCKCGKNYEGIYNKENSEYIIKLIPNQ